jgi:hypothetical protein
VDGGVGECKETLEKKNYSSSVFGWEEKCGVGTLGVTFAHDKFPRVSVTQAQRKRQCDRYGPWALRSPVITLIPPVGITLCRVASLPFA